MVMYTVNDATGFYDLGGGPLVTKVITQVAPSGETAYFFTDSTIYNASMFAIRDAHGNWSGTLFYGRTTIDADGQAGFVPDAQVEGDVRGLTVDAFALRYVNSHSSSQALTSAIFEGDDTLIGNRYGGALAGRGGNDLIIGPAGASHDLSGGGGDDVLHSFAGPLTVSSAFGGGGDDFIFMSDAVVTAKGGRGDDTFFFSHVPSMAAPVETVYSFRVQDRFQLDPNSFAALANGFGKDNFVVGPEAVDANDYIIFSPGVLFYDADGNGGEAKVALIYLDSKSDGVTWENIVVSDAVPDAGDHSAATPPAHHDAHAWAIHAGIHATGLIP